MGTSITGPDPNAATWPINCGVSTSITRPTGDVAVGGTYPALLHITDDSQYVNEKGASTYYRINVVPFSLPTGARVTLMSPYVRARKHTGNAKYSSFKVGLGDHSNPKAPYSEIPGAQKQYTLPATTFHPFTCNHVVKTSTGKLVTQHDINKGIYILFGLHTGYGQSSAATGGIDISRAYMRYTYDMPPTADIVSPALGSTISTTNAPIITWDYSDDFQAQAKYQVKVYDDTSTQVYDSGLVVTADTFHALTDNLDNGDYTATVLVYQAWNGLGGNFPANAVASTTFTIDVLSLGTPRIAISPVNEHVEVTVYPDVNLLSFDVSTIDNGYLSWTGTNVTVSSTASPIRDGSQSLKCAVTNTTTPNVMTPFADVPCEPGQKFKVSAYINPLALASRTATLAIVWLDSTQATLSTSSGSSTPLTINTWNLVTAATLTAPANAAWIRVKITFGGTSVADAIYVDDVGLWNQVDTATLPTWSRGGFFETTPNLLSFADSSADTADYIWEENSTTWPGSNLVVSASGVHGVNAFNLTRNATGTGTIGMTLGESNFIPVDAGAVYACYAQVKALTNARTVEFIISWFTANQTPSATASSTVSVAETLNTWVKLGGTVTAPTDAAYMTVNYVALAVANQTEQHLIDAIAVYPSAYTHGNVQYERGLYPNTDTAPTILVEYTDDGVLWKELERQTIFSLQGSFLFYDYTIKSSISGQTIQRTYRASLLQIENSIQLNSGLSLPLFTSLTLANVWLHADEDPVNTSYNYHWDGGGRTQTIDAKGTSVDIDGRDYPFAQFGVNSMGSIAVSLHLDTLADLNALNALAARKSVVVFRDQRGRSLRGMMGAVQIEDAVYGVAQEGSFTLVLTGIQP